MVISELPGVPAVGTVDRLGRMEDQIAQTALQHYHHVLPRKGKPTHGDNRKEWTVFAAIVATRHSSDCWVVSSATGTKCTAVQRNHWESSCLIHDSHAEVLARRGFIRVLWREIQAASHSRQADEKVDLLLLERTNDDPPIFALRRGVELHMYISDSPCGDASIYQLDSLGSSADGCTQFTGSKLVVPEGVSLCPDHACLIGDNTVVREPGTQMLGKLRTKSGRSNLAVRSTSMSCSDKIVRWGVLGLQGGSLSSLVPVPIRLQSCVVDRDPRNTNSSQQLLALDRSVRERIVDVAQELKQNPDVKIAEFANSISPPTVHVVDLEMSTFGKAAMEKERTDQSTTKKRKREERSQAFPAAGISLNWTQIDRSTEIIVGARGSRQGRKPLSHEDFEALESRLSRNRIQRLAESQGNCEPLLSYEEWKVKCTSPLHRRVRLEVFANGPLSGWIVGGGSAKTQSSESIS